MKRTMVIVLCTFIAATTLGCRKEGAAEKAGREVDEAVDKIQHGDEGALEKAGRKLDEAADDAKDELEDAKEDAKD